MENVFTMFWNILLTLVVAPAFLMFRSLMAEVKRVDILLNRTREDYATKNDHGRHSNKTGALHRVEDKLHRALSRVSNGSKQNSADLTTESCGLSQPDLGLTKAHRCHNCHARLPTQPKLDSS